MMYPVSTLRTSYPLHKHQRSTQTARTGRELIAHTANICVSLILWRFIDSRDR
ncbi:hypothetical protein DPMN_138566 [Dreissena polymorpha]|uniref:Uncharacterized protein n=1 Tax=Dreissena polymorpha TaxID=45954 RepID=A0A9D4G4Q0_DREPO|nr:hypothetical protein DPMN_138566 [Dreissena polymorpha]